MYQRILVPIDGSAPSLAGLDEAIQLARLTGGQIRLLHCIDDLSLAAGYEGFAPYAGDAVAVLKQAGEEILQAARARVAKAGLAVDTHLVETFGLRLVDQVDEQVRAWAADLVVIGTHGRRGIGRALLGSDAEQVVRTSTVPVLLVRAKA